MKIKFKRNIMLKDNIKYLGVHDSKLDLFEGQYKIPKGISYNSYAVIDQRAAVFDTVDKKYGDTWLKNIETALDGRAPDFLIVQHMEPDHSANIRKFTDRYSDAKIVASKKAFDMMGAFFGTDFADRQIVIKDGDTLDLGKYKFTFIATPMVHWPEVIMTYESNDGLLFSADAFGRFGSASPDEPWCDEARRYYIGIVGKYGTQVQNLLRKVSALEINAILPLHGPTLTKSIAEYVRLYDTWSSYKPEETGVLIACASIYGNTMSCAAELKEMLRERGVKAELFDLTRCDISEAIANAFRYDKLVLASVTYNAEIFPPMRTFITGLIERGFTGRRVAFIENGSWAPMATKVMREMLDACKNIEYCECGVKLISAQSAESRAATTRLADELTK